MNIRLLSGLALLLGLSVTAQPYFPIRNGVLQTDLDARSNAIVNVGGLEVTGTLTAGGDLIIQDSAATPRLTFDALADGFGTDGFQWLSSPDGTNLFFIGPDSVVSTAPLEAQNGITLGGTTRTTWPSSNPVYNVADYGATPDDSSNNGDHLAIQTAITNCGTAGGGTIFFPPGTYYFSATSYFPELTSEAHQSMLVFRSQDSNIRLEAVPGTVTFKPEDSTGSASVMNFIGSGDSVGSTNWNGASNIVFYGITFDMGGTDNDDVWDCTQVYKAGQWTFDHCTFSNIARGDAIDTGCTVLQLNNLTFRNITGSAVHPSVYGSGVTFADGLVIDSVTGTDMNGSAIEVTGGIHWWNNVYVTNSSKIFYQFGKGASHFKGWQVYTPATLVETNFHVGIGTATFDDMRFTAIGSPTGNYGVSVFVTNAIARFSGCDFTGYPAIMAKDCGMLTIDADCTFQNAIYSTTMPTLWVDNCDNARISGLYKASGQTAMVFTNGASDNVLIEGASFYSMNTKVYDPGTNKVFTGNMARSSTLTHYNTTNTQPIVFKGNHWVGGGVTLQGKSNVIEQCNIDVLTLQNSGCSSNVFRGNRIGTLTISGSTSAAAQIWEGWNSTNQIGFLMGDGSGLTGISGGDFTITNDAGGTGAFTGLAYLEGTGAGFVVKDGDDAYLVIDQNTGDLSLNAANIGLNGDVVAPGTITAFAFELQDTGGETFHTASTNGNFLLTSATDGEVLQYSVSSNAFFLNGDLFLTGGLGLSGDTLDIAGSIAVSGTVAAGTNLVVGQSFTASNSTPTVTASTNLLWDVARLAARYEASGPVHLTITNVDQTTNLWSHARLIVTALDTDVTVTWPSAYDPCRYGGLTNGHTVPQFTSAVFDLTAYGPEYTNFTFAGCSQ